MKKGTTEADKSQGVLKIDYKHWNEVEDEEGAGTSDVMTFTINELEKIYTNEEVIYIETYGDKINISYWSS